jgi:hypothetical protein
MGVGNSKLEVVIWELEVGDWELIWDIRKC